MCVCECEHGVRIFLKEECGKKDSERKMSIEVGRWQ